MGKSEGCTIKNVSTFGTITATSEESSGNVGGIVGHAAYRPAGSGKSERDTVIESSTSHVDIATTGVLYVGGAVGYISNRLGRGLLNVSASPKPDTLATGVTRGKITLASSPTNPARVGGLIGSIQRLTSVERSSSSIPIVAPSVDGSVQDVGDSLGALKIGGLIGYASAWDNAWVKESFSSSPITLDLTAGKSWIYVGGLIRRYGQTDANYIFNTFFKGSTRVRLWLRTITRTSLPVGKFQVFVVHSWF